jgi:predicted DNA-binding ribbon-helix-helix protein
MGGRWPTASRLAASSQRYTQSMTTTIKVSDELRDRLKEQAARDGLTLGAHLAHLADAEDRRWRLSQLKSAIARTAATDSESHAAESAEWERTELSDANS